MSSAIPALPKKTQIRNPDADDSDNEEDIAIDSGSESGDDAAASSVGSDDDTASVAATSDESDNDADAGAAAAGDSSADEEADADADADADAAGGSDDEGRRGDVSKKTNKKKRAAASASSKKNLEDDMTLLGVPHGIHFEDDEDDEDDDDEDANKDSSEYFQKLKSSVRESYIDAYHPESLSHNYDEIQTLARVVRNSAGVIVDDLHRTIPIMTKYEKTRILGQRAKQINEGAPTFIKIDSTVIDGYLIAVKELEQKKTPFIIRRPLPNGGSEYWRVQDLEIL
jgi:DNA-directed RNA polymerase I, II, and III subunit RPABC2